LRHLFLFIGAAPNTTWLNGCVAVDDKGLVITAANWAFEAGANSRRVLPLETSRPGILPIGDVRAGSTAVGEGVAVVAQNHRVLRPDKPRAWIGCGAACLVKGWRAKKQMKLAYPGSNGQPKRRICPGMEFETPCACTTLRRAARAVTASYDAALAPSGLRITQFSILRRLARLGPLAITRLATEAALDRSTMGRNLNPLERRGLVRIEVGDVDQRERIAYLTAAGEAAMKAALPYWRKAQKRIAALVPPSVVAELADQLDAFAVSEQGRRREETQLGRDRERRKTQRS